jgi:hypothetical protein
MSNYTGLQKIIKKGKKIVSPINLQESLQKQISENYNDKISREFHFLTLYYGLQGKAMTLENIGQAQENPLTRERVRQIIDSVIEPLQSFKSEAYINPYLHSVTVFDEILGTERSFLRLEELTENAYFTDFLKNVKGLIAFLNDCGIRQIAYRKNYYFYPSRLERKNVIQDIQKENKNIRREHTLEKMSLKSKTVTYVPDEVRKHLLVFAEKHKMNLNPLYEQILNDFMEQKPYASEEYVFSRTKSWKARKGKAKWQQIGIYIERCIFDNIKDDVQAIKRDLKKSVSLMSFICQAFVWHYEKNHK